MPKFHLKTVEKRIGVVGLYNAGKTVLLTSLINHLENHDPDRFAIGKPGTSLRKFTPLPVEPGWAPFNAAGFRDALVHRSTWPEKTRDRSAYACQFERSDWTFADVKLKLYDLPGERLADAAMYNRDFAAWSDHMLARIGNDTPYRTTCEPYLLLLQKPDASAEQLLGSYKLALAKLILGFKPMISPSTFLLDAQGHAARPGSAESLAASRLCGIAAGQEFTPLSAAARSANPQLAETFAEHYRRYQAEMVEPFLVALRSCHSLVVLVDVLMLLAGGVGMYDDNRQILQDLFHVLEPGENFPQLVKRHVSNILLPHALRPGGITRVAFVAPKLDLVPPRDRDRVQSLLKHLVGKLAENRDGLSARFFSMAAVVSTRPMPGVQHEHDLVGVPYRTADGRKIAAGAEQRFTVSNLPDDWPANWHAGAYSFPEVYPSVPTRKDCPPDQINLNRVFEFLLD